MAGMHDERHPLPLTDHAARRSLVRAAARLLGPTEAEDAVQDAYVRVLESGTGTDGLNAAQAWLHPWCATRPSTGCGGASGWSSGWPS